MSIRRQFSGILVLAPEGDSTETCRFYVQELMGRYELNKHQILVFACDELRGSGKRIKNLKEMKSAIDGSLKRLVQSPEFRMLGDHIEVHAQGGFGAYLATRLTQIVGPGKLERIFLVGGAPCEAMTLIAKVFHRFIAPLWYFSRIPFFADDPPYPDDSKVDGAIKEIRDSSTQAMRANPRFYMLQLLLIGYWSVNDVHFGWGAYRDVGDALEPTPVFFIPNGETNRPWWWDNTYHPKNVVKIWEYLSVMVLDQPDSYFSYYSMQPLWALFKVMDDVTD